MCRRFVSYETEMALKEKFLEFNIFIKRAREELKDGQIFKKRAGFSVVIYRR